MQLRGGNGTVEYLFVFVDVLFVEVIFCGSNLQANREKTEKTCGGISCGNNGVHPFGHPVKRNSRRARILSRPEPKEEEGGRSPSPSPNYVHGAKVGHH